MNSSQIRIVRQTNEVIAKKFKPWVININKDWIKNL